MVDTFDADIAKCHVYIDSVAKMTGRHIGTAQSVVNEYNALNSDNARLKATLEKKTMECNRLKRWISKL